jgi:gluconokinase
VFFSHAITQIRARRKRKADNATGMSAFVLMGVSGSGKTTVGQCVAGELDLPFIEGDEFHPQQNIDKMSAGIPLTEADREPWIDALAIGINNREAAQDVIVACSALSQHVRDRLRNALAEPLHFIFLTAPAAVIQQRLDARPRHFMKSGMLQTQLQALEPPSDAITVDANRPFLEVCRQVAGRVREQGM